MGNITLTAIVMTTLSGCGTVWEANQFPPHVYDLKATRDEAGSDELTFYAKVFPASAVDELSLTFPNYPEIDPINMEPIAKTCATIVNANNVSGCNYSVTMNLNDVPGFERELFQVTFVDIYGASDYKTGVYFKPKTEKTQASYINEKIGEGI